MTCWIGGWLWSDVAGGRWRLSSSSSARQSAPRSVSASADGEPTRRAVELGVSGLGKWREIRSSGQHARAMPMASCEAATITIARKFTLRTEGMHDHDSRVEIRALLPCRCGLESENGFGSVTWDKKSTVLVTCSDRFGEGSVGRGLRSQSYASKQGSHCCTRERLVSATQMLYLKF